MIYIARNKEGGVVRVSAQRESPQDEAWDAETSVEASRRWPEAWAAARDKHRERMKRCDPERLEDEISQLKQRLDALEGKEAGNERA